MKKFCLLILLSLAVIPLWGQAKVKTRKYLLSDFQDKITKVVLPGEGMLEAALRQEVCDRWTASPFEFCTVGEYEALLESSDYYFLVPSPGRFKEEAAPGIVFLTLLKGGSEAEGEDPRTEVISLPLCPVGAGSGRELVYLPALVEAVQSYALAAMQSEKTAYLGYSFFNENYLRKGHIKRIYLSREDLSPKVGGKDIARYVDTDDFILCDEDQADDVFTDGVYGTLVGFVIAPEHAVEGSYSYQLLIEADTHTIFYIRKHKITPKDPAGFSVEDLRRLARKR